MSGASWWYRLPGFGLTARVAEIEETDRLIREAQARIAEYRRTRRAQVARVETRIAELWTPEEIAAARACAGGSEDA